MVRHFSCEDFTVLKACVQLAAFMSMNIDRHLKAHVCRRLSPRERLRKRFDWLDKQLAGKHYLTGDKFTIADAFHGAALVDFA